jgi:muconolactone delta-isomerase
MQFLTVSRRKTEQFSAEAFTPELVEKEANRGREMYTEGILRQVWFRGDEPGAVILWEAANEAEVKTAVESLPLFRAGMLEILMIVPLKPYPGFAPRK